MWELGSHSLGFNCPLDGKSNRKLKLFLMRTRSSYHLFCLKVGVLLPLHDIIVHVMIYGKMICCYSSTRWRSWAHTGNDNSTTSWCLVQFEEIHIHPDTGQTDLWRRRQNECLLLQRLAESRSQSPLSAQPTNDKRRRNKQYHSIATIDYFNREDLIDVVQFCRKRKRERERERENEGVIQDVQQH